MDAELRLRVGYSRCEVIASCGSMEASAPGVHIRIAIAALGGLDAPPECPQQGSPLYRAIGQFDKIGPGRRA